MKKSDSSKGRIIRKGNIYPSGGEAGQIVSDEGICPTVKQAKRGGMTAIPLVSLDSSRCSAESEGSGSDWKGVIRLSDIRQKGKIKKHKIAPTLTKDNKQGDTQPLIVEDFYKARKPRESKIAPALRSDRTGLKVYDIYNQRMRKDETVGTLRPNFTKGSRSGFVLGYSRANKKNKDGKIEISYHEKKIFGALKGPTGNQRDFVVSGLKQSRGFETRKDELSHAIKGAGGGSSKNFVASGRTTTTNTPARSTGKGSGIKRVQIGEHQQDRVHDPRGIAPTIAPGTKGSGSHLSKIMESGMSRASFSKETSETSQRAKYPTMTSSQLVSLVRVFPLRDNVEVFKTSQGELFSLRSAECYEIKNRATYSLRTLRDYFLTTRAEPSRSYSFRWMNLGMMRNGLSQTLSITCRRTVRGSLSSVLEEKADEKYYLSEKTLEKIMEKKDAHPDIRWKSGIKGEGRVPFPDDPDKPSRAITTAESGANRMTHGVIIDFLHAREEGKPRVYKDVAPTLNQRDYKEPRCVLIHNKYGGFGEKEPRIFEEISPTIRTPKGGGHLPDVVEPVRWRRTEKGKKARRESQRKGRDYTPFNEGHRELAPSKKGVVGCITNALNKDALILADRTRSYADKGRNLESPKPITNALSGVQKDNLLIANTVTPDAYLARGERERINGKAVLTSMYKRRIRRLTPKECERLQGFPDDWTLVPAIGNDAGTTYDYETGETIIRGKVMSDTQRYKMMGNAVSVPVIEAIGRRILETSRE